MRDYFMQTYTGIRFNLLDPTEDMIVIEDIAHHLSQINRFCGAAKFPYSVAYHSILACQLAPEKYKLELLLHEIDEPYIGDLAYPFKCLLNDNSNDLVKAISNQIKLVADDKF